MRFVNPALPCWARFFAIPPGLRNRYFFFVDSLPSSLCFLNLWILNLSILSLSPLIPSRPNPLPTLWILLRACRPSLRRH